MKIYRKFYLHCLLMNFFMLMSTNVGASWTDQEEQAIAHAVDGKRIPVEQLPKQAHDSGEKIQLSYASQMLADAYYAVHDLHNAAIAYALAASLDNHDVLLFLHNDMGVKGTCTAENIERALQAHVT